MTTTAFNGSLSLRTINAWVEAHDSFKRQAAALAGGAEGEELERRLAPISGRLAAIAPVLAQLKALADRPEMKVVAGEGSIAGRGLDRAAEAMRLLEALAIAEGFVPGPRELGANQVAELTSQSAHLSLTPAKERLAEKWGDFLVVLVGLSPENRIALIALIMSTLFSTIQLYRDFAKDRAQPVDQ